MKLKHYLCLALFIPFSTLIAQDEEKLFNKFVFKMSPQHLTLNMLKVGLESFNKTRTISYTANFNVAANNNNQDELGYYGGNFPYNGVGIELQMRKYLNKLSVQQTKRGREYFQSVYFSGFLQGGTYKKAFESTFVSTISAKNIALGFTIGLQRTLWKVLTVDGYIGAGYQLAERKIENYPFPYYYQGFTQPGFSGILPKVGLNIGVAL